MARRKKGWITDEEVTELFNRIGAPLPSGINDTHNVTVGVKSITFSVTGTTRAEVEENLRSMTSGGVDMDDIAGITLDWSNVEGLPEVSDSEWSPGTTDEEILATRTRIETGVRDWLMEQLSVKGRWCWSGINDVLDALGIEGLPEFKNYTIRREFTGVWEMSVEAFSEEDAKRSRFWRHDSDGEITDGTVYLKTMSDDITVELDGEDDD